MASLDAVFHVSGLVMMLVGGGLSFPGLVFSVFCFLAMVVHTVLTCSISVYLPAHLRPRPPGRSLAAPVMPGLASSLLRCKSMSSFDGLLPRRPECCLSFLWFHRLFSVSSLPCMVDSYGQVARLPYLPTYLPSHSHGPQLGHSPRNQRGRRSSQSVTRHHHSSVVAVVSRLFHATSPKTKVLDISQHGHSGFIPFFWWLPAILPQLSHFLYTCLAYMPPAPLDADVNH